MRTITFLLLATFIASGLSACASPEKPGSGVSAEDQRERRDKAMKEIDREIP